MNGLANAGIYFLATSLVLIIAIFIFDLVTKYKIWDEINKGNLAVGFSTGGIILGVAFIMKCAIDANSKLLDTILWGGIGTLVLLVIYFAFEILTIKLRVSEEISRGNKAVGLISFLFSIAFSLIIGASIS